MLCRKADRAHPIFGIGKILSQQLTGTSRPDFHWENAMSRFGLCLLEPARLQIRVVGH